jgi:hypothetical protein
MKYKKQIMPRFFILLCCLLGFQLQLTAQSNVKTQAEKMGQALVSKNYVDFTRYTYPKILKEMGGTEKMAATIRSQMENMEKTGVKILSLSYGEPSEIIKEKKEWQCTVPQIMTLKINSGKIISKTTLIAISQDEGKQWYFVDAGERDLETVRITLPNLSKKLVLPPMEMPQMISE